MGLFQKSKSTEQSKDDLPQYVDNLLENSGQSTNEEIDERFSVENMALGANYSIDQAVALMRDLPDDQSDIVVSVVTKTLQSANINVTKIIDEARNKEGALESDIEKLNADIESLQAEIANRKEQITVTNAILEETRKVRNLLERADTCTDKDKGKKSKSGKADRSATATQGTQNKSDSYPPEATAEMAADAR
jgi:DNA gyrase/topoisomerase IV subunit A